MKTCQLKIKQITQQRGGKSTRRKDPSLGKQKILKKGWTTKEQKPTNKFSKG